MIDNNIIDNRYSELDSLAQIIGWRKDRILVAVAADQGLYKLMPQ